MVENVAPMPRPMRAMAGASSAALAAVPECAPRRVGARCGSRPAWADIVLSGTVSVKELESNLAALALQLDPRLVERLAAIH
jgi:aryl-alcohol dehydrogenase-like predicted oxidoreductase